MISITSGKIFRLTTTLNVEQGAAKKGCSLSAESNIINSANRFHIHVHFRIPERQFATISLSDVTGHTIQEVVKGHFDAGEHASMIDTRSLPNGIYLLRLSCASGYVFQKILVVK